MKKLQNLQFSLKSHFSSQKLKPLPNLDNEQFQVAEDSSQGDIYLQPRKQHQNTLIWLHGLGDTSFNFAAVFLNEFKLQTNTKIILAQAPEINITINMGAKMPGWYDIKSFDRTYLEATPQTSIFQSNLKRIESLIEEEAKVFLNNSQKIFLGGFSQGCALALATGLQFNKPLGGIIGLSGYFMTTLKVNPVQKDTKTILFHGVHDGVIPYSYSRDTYEVLKQQKNNIKFQSLNIDHELAQEEFQQLKELLNEN